ncbi:hypothetical protein AAMO2058_000490600 [Amorphochlora amoebiformis]
MQSLNQRASKDDTKDILEKDGSNSSFHLGLHAKSVVANLTHLVTISKLVCVTFKSPGVNREILRDWRWGLDDEIEISVPCANLGCLRNRRTVLFGKRNFCTGSRTPKAHVDYKGLLLERGIKIRKINTAQWHSRMVVQRKVIGLAWSLHPNTKPRVRPLPSTPKGVGLGRYKWGGKCGSCGFIFGAPTQADEYRFYSHQCRCGHTVFTGAKIDEKARKYENKFQDIRQHRKNLTLRIGEAIGKYVGDAGGTQLSRRSVDAEDARNPQDAQDAQDPQDARDDKPRHGVAKIICEYATW